jgi:formamidopyrimidine-DNA glycosylase
MPELPEVEIIARGLRKTIVGKRVAGIALSGLPLRKPVGEAFAKKLQGRIIRKIHRRGKYLIAEMEPHAFWLVHLGMSGRLHYLRTVNQPSKHMHATVSFSDATRLEYCDPRRFGMLAIYEVGKLSQIPEIGALGLEPLSSKLNPESLAQMLKKCRREVKAFLLDQKNIAGLGNIYVSEALHCAGVHPARRCFTLNRDEAGRLVHAVRRTLSEAIRNRGTSFSDFRDSDGKPGGHQKFLHIFQREGEKCSRCGSVIMRLRQSNRSTFYCPHCQK